MASLYFFIQSKKKGSNIYINFSLNGKTKFKRKTNETIDPKLWNGKVFSKGFPKNIQSGSKELISQNQKLRQRLYAIESFIYKEFSNEENKESISIDWLEEKLLTFYNDGNKINELEILLNYLPHYKTNILPFRLYRGNKISYRTIQKQSTIIDYLNEFITIENPKMKISNYDKSISNKFENFLRNEKRLSDNTIGKYIKYSKTILKEAKSENIPVNPQLEDIKGFTVETPTVYLELEELKQIQNLKVLTEYLQISRDWLIIGCYTGQRASDLFRMNHKMIINIDGHKYLNLIQQKVKHPVQIPLHDEVKRILDKRNGKFPPLYSENIESNKTLFNQSLKDICRIANIDRIVKGRKYDKINKSFVHGSYALHEIVSSHICRRTFASMYYGKIPNQIIMSVTGHKTEKEFLQYIGVDNSELSKQMYKYWNTLKQNNNNTSNARKKVN